MRVRSALVAATVLWGGVFAAHVAGRQEHVHHAPAQARMLTSPLELSEADLTAGQTTYESRCAGCHGRAGTGGAEPKKELSEKAMKAVGRNEPCPCGSGKKYKSCHGAAQ